MTNGLWPLPSGRCLSRSLFPCGVLLLSEGPVPAEARRPLALRLAIFPLTRMAVFPPRALLETSGTIYSRSAWQKHEDL